MNSPAYNSFDTLLGRGEDWMRRNTASTWAAQVLTTRENMDLLRHQSAAVNLSYTHADIARIREKLENMATGRVQ